MTMRRNGMGCFEWSEVVGRKAEWWVEQYQGKLSEIFLGIPCYRCADSIKLVGWRDDCMMIMC